MIDLIRRLTTCLLLAAIGLAVSFSPSHAQSPGIPTIEMTVPQPGASDPAVVGVRLLVDVATTGPVQLRIEKTSTNSSTPSSFSATTLTEGDTAAGSGTRVDEVTFDSVTVPVSGGDQRAELVLDLPSNFDPSTFLTTLTGNEVWSIEAVSGGITGACPISYIIDPSSFSERVLVSGNYPTPPVQVSGAGRSLPEPACESFRPGVDAVLVLDKSGSMSNSDLSPVSPQPKIDALAEAVTDFANVWNDLRDSETLLAPNSPSDSVPSPNDRLALVFFDRDVATVPWISSGLQTFDTALKDNIVGNISSVSPGGATSLGDGLVEADNILGAASGNRKVVLAMSDGKENSNLRVDVNDPINPTEVRTFPTGAAEADKNSLPNQGDYQIYTVTVGTSTAVSADINEDIATATGGFYINSEDDADQMRPFFLQLLQNFLRFNSQQIVALSQQELPVGITQSLTFPVTSTSVQLSVNLLTERSDGYFEMVLTSPDGAFTEEIAGSGGLRFTTALPVDTTEYAGEWTAEVTFVDPAEDVETATGDFLVITDDLGVDAEFEIVPQDYESGDALQLRARLSDLRGPITGLSGNGRVEARIVQPDVSIGELLAESSVQPSPQRTDPGSPADAKLRQLLDQRPDLLERVSRSVQLVDDGTNGDATAGDGIYSGRYPVEAPGHYNVLFLAEGPTERSGDFSRAQLKTAHVRHVPNNAQTEVVARVQNQNLVLTVTPRTLDGSRMPGFQNYFWLTPDQGNAIRLEDQLNGQYVAQVPMNGAQRPQVDLHFLRVSSPISDEARPETLPVKLGDATTVVPSIENGKERGQGGNTGDGGGICPNNSAEGTGIILFGVLMMGGLLVARRRYQERRDDGA
jgi:hypothetical protein